MPAVAAAQPLGDARPAMHSNGNGQGHTCFLTLHAPTQGCLLTYPATPDCPPSASGPLAIPAQSLELAPTTTSIGNVEYARQPTYGLAAECRSLTIIDQRAVVVFPRVALGDTS